jgi:hypothetical protein
MDSMPATIDQATRTAVTARITAHVQRGWPRLGALLVRFRGQFCYVDAVLPGHRQPAPILRLRYQGSADRWDIGIYLASDERYTESELPASFGPKAGTPEQGIDHTFILYAGPRAPAWWRAWSKSSSMSGACGGTPMEDTSASSWPPWAAPIVARRPVNRACTARKGWR